MNSVLLILFLLIQYGIWVGQSNIGAYLTLKKEVAAQRDENQRNNDRNQILYAEINDLRNGQEAIEERARNELGMIREGEIFYRVVEQ
ncbi:MAG: cell division protein FtsB [Enterobacterales bacterium]|nr:cell division protein FtsB [Enterobacterales bacterium]